MRKLLALLLVACGGAAAVAPKPAPSAANSATPKPKSIASATPSTSTSAVVATDPGPPVDLLWETNAQMAVSSKVDNDADRPEHLVDHKAETAWNGKTGNLVGAWIKVRLPEDVKIDHLLLTVGFDKTTPKGEDLFTENHRITKVRISRAGKVLRDVALDPNDRKPQKIPMATAGGEIQIEVLEVTPGTKPNWKEIAVSEIAVMGIPGVQRKAKPGPPSVWVGHLDMKELAYEETTGATYLAACLAWAAADTQAVTRQRAKYAQVAYGTYTDQSTCSGPKKLKPGKGAILDTAHFDEATATQPFYGARFVGEVLAFRTADGARFTNIRLGGAENFMYGGTDYKTLSESWVGDQLIIDVEHHVDVTSDGAGSDEDRHTDEKTIYRTTCDAATGKCMTIEKSTTRNKP